MACSMKAATEVNEPLITIKITFLLSTRMYLVPAHLLGRSSLALRKTPWQMAMKISYKKVKEVRKINVYQM